MHFTRRCLSGDEGNELLKMKPLYAERSVKRLQWVTLSYKSWPCSAQSGHVAYVLLMQRTVQTKKISFCHFHIHNARCLHTHTTDSTSMLLSHPLQFPPSSRRGQTIEQLICVLALTKKREAATAAFAYRPMQYTLNLMRGECENSDRCSSSSSLPRQHQTQTKTPKKLSWSPPPLLLLLNSWHALTFKKWRR